MTFNLVFLDNTVYFKARCNTKAKYCIQIGIKFSQMLKTVFSLSFKKNFHAILQYHRLLCRTDIFEYKFLYIAIH